MLPSRLEEECVMDPTAVDVLGIYELCRRRDPACLDSCDDATDIRRFFLSFYCLWTPPLSLDDNDLAAPASWCVSPWEEYAWSHWRWGLRRHSLCDAVMMGELLVGASWGVKKSPRNAVNERFHSRTSVTIQRIAHTYLVWADAKRQTSLARAHLHTNNTLEIVASMPRLRRLYVGFHIRNRWRELVTPLAIRLWYTVEGRSTLQKRPRYCKV